MRKSILVFIVLLGIIFSTVIPSRAFRCGGRIVSIGDRTLVILKRCGNPEYKEIIRHGIKKPKLENWVYRYGCRYYYLLFKDGKLIEIESFKE